MDNRNFQFMFYGFFAGWAIIGFYVVLLGLREGKAPQGTGPRASNGGASR